MTIAPQKAGQNPSTLKGSLSSPASQSVSRNNNAFTTNAINPSVNT